MKSPGPEARDRLGPARYVVRFPPRRTDGAAAGETGAGSEVVEFCSWAEAEASIRARGYDPAKAKVHSRATSPTGGSSPTRPASSLSVGEHGGGDGIRLYRPPGLATPTRSSRAAGPSPGAAAAAARTDYLMRDRLRTGGGGGGGGGSAAEGEGRMRLETSYDVMSRRAEHVDTLRRIHVLISHPHWKA